MNDSIKLETVSSDIEERRAIFERMKNACCYIPNLDEHKELAEYREKKYGY